MPGHLADGGRPRGMPPDGEQQLVLGGGHVRRQGQVLAPVEEAAHGVPELEQMGVVRVGERRKHLVVRYLLVVVTSTRRLVLLAALAVVIGLGGGVAAYALVHLIALLTNLAFFHRVGWSLPSFAHLHRSPLVVLVAVGGAMVVTVMARWAPVIRGHGIPEAMEAILTRQSRIAPRTALA